MRDGFSIGAGEGGLEAVMELLHLFLESPRWEESAMERAKQMYLSHYRSLSKGLERATADRVMSCMLGPDRCTPDNTETYNLRFCVYQSQHGFQASYRSCLLSVLCQTMSPGFSRLRFT